MPRVRKLQTLVAVLVASIMLPLCPIRARAATDTRPPNVVLLFIDNVGYGDLGCYGNEHVRTPHIDHLATQGTRCTSFYIGSPSCAPSRGALLTGRHPERNGLNWQLRTEESFQIGLPLTEKLLPEYLQPLGYATACFGKWNIGFGEGARPTERGFDEFFGHVSGNIDYYTHVYNGWNDLRRGTQEVTVEGYSTDLFADAACDLIRRHRDEPFLVYVPFNAAHYPNPKNKAPDAPVEWQAPAEFLALYGALPDEQNQQIRYRAVLSALDAAIGRIVSTLDETGLAENSIVVVLSDNGAFMLPGRGLEVASNLPFREGGVTLYEGGIRVPCVIRWPGHIAQGGVCDEMLTSMDLLPLFLLAAGGTLPADRTLDGRDPRAPLAGRSPSPHEELCWVWGRQSALRRGDWKLIRSATDAGWELYDLKSDPRERQDLAARHPEIVYDLTRRFDEWHASISVRH